MLGLDGLSGSVRAITLGSRHACALVGDGAEGSILCWGANDTGQLASAPGGPQLRAMPLAAAITAVQIAAGADATCTVAPGASGLCWGGDQFGQLGDARLTMRSTPAPVKNLTAAARLAAGTYFACAVLADGDARCWGSNAFGQVGDGTDTDRYVPTPLAWR